MSQHSGKELGRDLSLELPVAVIGKHRGIPGLLVQRHVEKPAEQNVVADLFDQLSLTADRIEGLKQ